MRFKNNKHFLEALIYNKENEKELFKFCKYVRYSPTADLFFIKFADKTTYLTKGDFIVKNHKGIFNVYGPKEFSKKYKKGVFVRGRRSS